MDTFNPRGSKHHGPEHQIQQAIINYLRIKGWYVMSTHGNQFQRGFPDLFCCHSSYGHRWVEVKEPNHGKFTAAQLDCFPKICAHGSGVWVMVAATDSEYEKLFKSPNWHLFRL